MTNGKKVFSFVVRSIRPFKFYLFLHFFVIIFTAINISLVPLVSKILLNKIITTDHSLVIQETMHIMMFLAFLIVLPNIVLRISDYAWTMFLPKLRHQITHESIQKLLNQSHHFFQNNFSGSLVNKVRDLFNSTPKIIEIFLYTIQI
jgi:ATP-binding cassette subfamily B protein